MIAENLWRIRAHRMEMQKLAAKIQGLTSTAQCYKLARDCYRILAKHDEAKKEGYSLPCETYKVCENCRFRWIWRLSREECPRCGYPV